MAKLRLGLIESNKPIRITIELPADVHRDLLKYAEVHAKETGQKAQEPTKLVGPMIERFMATDRAFAKARRADATSNKTTRA